MKQLPWYKGLLITILIAALTFWAWDNWIARRVGPNTPGLVIPAHNARLQDLMTLAWHHNEPDATRLANLQFLICIYDKATGEGCGWPGAPMTPPSHRRWTALASAISSSAVPNSNLTEYTFPIPDVDALIPPVTMHWTVGACELPRTDKCVFALERQFELLPPPPPIDPNIAADVSISFSGITNEFSIDFIARGDPVDDTGPFDYSYRFVPIRVDGFGQRILTYADGDQFVTNECKRIPATVANESQREAVANGNLTVGSATFSGPPLYPAGRGIPGGTSLPTPVHEETGISASPPAGMAACLSLDPNGTRTDDASDNFAFEWEYGL